MTRSRAILTSFVVCAAVLSIRAAIESPGGLHAEYTDTRWGAIRSGVDRQISRSTIERAWNYSAPSAFAVRWSGFLVAPRPGWYTVATTSDDGSRVTIDGFLVVDNFGRHSTETRSGRVRLTRGAHPVTIEYFQSGASYEMAWSWARENSPLTPVPAWALWTVPVSASRAQSAHAIDVVAAISVGVLIVALLVGLWHARPTMFGLRTDWALLLILLFGAYFRLQYLDLPMAEAHSWRQITNADIARNFAEGSLNILLPRVSWGGAGEAYVGMEFPLLQWTAAVFFRLLGERDVICRSISVAFSLATIVALWGLGRCLWSPAVGRAAGFLYAVSPSAIFFGRAFISDTPMVCFSAFGVWGFASYLRSGRRASLIWGTVTAALACMVKVPAVIIFAPIVCLAFDLKRWSLLRDRALVAALTTVFLLTVAWYGYADVLFHRTGLGEAIWHPSGGYSPDIMEAAGPTMTVSHWSTLAELRDPDFYRAVLERLWYLHLTPVVAVVTLFGLAVLWGVPRRRMVDAWLATVVLFILVSAQGNRWHEFHQLPILLPAALYFGFAARPAFDGEWLRRQAPFGVAAAGSLVVLSLIGLMGVRDSRVVQDMFRPANLDLRPVILGQHVQDLTPAGALIITVEYPRYGGNSPILLYHSRRRGWSFDVAGITPQVVQRLHTQYGAQYFVTLIWSDLVQQRPALASYLETQDRVPLDGPRDAAMFALR